MFTLSIVCPERIHWEGSISSLVVPGTEGYLGVLSNHAPLITALRNGKIEFRDAEDDLHVMAVSGGFLEVSNNVATLLADTVENADDIDAERARNALERANERLSSVDTDIKEAAIDVLRAREALQRARNRIRIYDEAH
jgi:F-type H+-transporting ATPase subunit epsilon